MGLNSFKDRLGYQFGFLYYFFKILAGDYDI